MSLPEKPLTRRELYLAKAAGQDVTLPETDLTREEMYLREIANGGGGGGDVTKEYVDNAIANAVADIDDDISALSDTVADKVDKVNGKGLSTNDYTDADKALVADSPITVTATASPISTANGKPRKLTIYGKSEVVDGAIKSAGEGYGVVRLADLLWTNYPSQNRFFASLSNAQLPSDDAQAANIICAKYTTRTWDDFKDHVYDDFIAGVQTYIGIRDTNCTTVSELIASLGDTELVYQLVDPTQGNNIAIKTDNGTGIDGTMAVFSTGTPLYGVSADIRDVMEWNGSAGTATKNCAKVRLADLSQWTYNAQFNIFIATISNIYIPTTAYDRNHLLCDKYISYTGTIAAIMPDKSISTTAGNIFIKDTDYTTVNEFVTSLGDVELIYELATPTTEQLTQTENESIASLRTFSPQTAITINDNPEFEVEAYANTANGQAISDMQPTRSPLLTLTASSWTNNAQTVSYEHDTSKRNVIDVDPASVEEWASCGVLAISETATGITFKCSTVPENALNFRVTSMGV